VNLMLRAFDPNGTEVTFKGANDPEAPVSQRLAARLAAQARLEALEAYRPFHPHDGSEKLTPSEVHEVDVEICRPRSSIRRATRWR
jgi:hypothetical protein